MLAASPVLPDDDSPFNLDKVSCLISLIDNEVSKSLSSVCLTSTPINESNPKSPKLVSAFTVEGSFTPTEYEAIFFKITNSFMYLVTVDSHCLEFG